METLLRMKYLTDRAAQISRLTSLVLRPQSATEAKYTPQGQNRDQARNFLNYPNTAAGATCILPSCNKAVDRVSSNWGGKDLIGFNYSI